MQDSQVAIQCTNPNCQAANPFDNKMCQQCGTPIVKRYLRVLGLGMDAYKIGDLLDDRYLIVQKGVVLDFYPGLPPKITEDLPESIVTYLKLSAFKPHIPQVYGLASTKDHQEVWLLEYGTVPLNISGKPEYPALLPKITDFWSSQSPLRQLNWLAQMAQLWQPLADKGAAATLLQSDLLRFNGTLLQLLELELGQDNPTLADLGKFWATWVVDCDPSIKEFCLQLCCYLESGQIGDIGALSAILTVAMQECGRSYYYQYRIFTYTDSGPMREHNEDSCYPDPGTLIQPKETEPSMAVVCDGVGGHDGGEIASRLTIEYLTEQLKHLSLDRENWDSEAVANKLAELVCGANDIISNRNDSEKRHQRQRMGTTLIMTFARAHEMYVTHVGDSRVYWITKNSCHQLTVDDDLASREVRLGYALYRDASQYPSAGALVQALGMSSSESLYPNIQRLILDEDGVFLLCSDGLSDFDRVEQYWESQIQPILNYNANIPKTGRELIKIANDRNGHDNVTIALVHCQVQRAAETKEVLDWSKIEAIASKFAPIKPRVSQIRTINTSKDSEVVHPGSSIFLSPPTQPQQIPPTVASQRTSIKDKWIWYLVLLPLFFALGFVIYLVFTPPKGKKDSDPPKIPDLESPTPSITPAPESENNPENNSDEFPNPRDNSEDSPDVTPTPDSILDPTPEATPNPADNSENPPPP